MKNADAGLDGSRQVRIDGAEMRRILGHFATGVTIITARHDDEPVGMAANSFTSVSLDPPLVLFCAGVESETWPQIKAAERFCVNVLGHRQRDLAVGFARKGSDRYDGVELLSRADGPPWMAGAIAHIDCRIAAEHPAGDHTLVLGEVLELSVSESDVEALEEPLIFYRGEFTTAQRRDS